MTAGVRNQKRKLPSKLHVFLLPPYLYLVFSTNCWYFISFKHCSICKHEQLQYFYFYGFKIHNARPKYLPPTLHPPCKYKLV